jgi:hypothetical protein
LKAYPDSTAVNYTSRYPLQDFDPKKDDSRLTQVTERLQMNHTEANRMPALSTICSVMLLLLSTLLFSQAAANQKTDSLCKAESLPSDVQNRLREEYGSWKIQEPADLRQRAREAWEPENPRACPGIAVGHFESMKTLSYAVLLVPTGHADEGYRFLVFGQKLGQSGYEARVLDKLDEKGAANYYIQTAPISKFFDEASRRKFQAHTKDGILLTDSGENEYGVEVYFWSGGRYRHEPIDY